MQVSFRVKKRHGLITTWDRLPSLRVERPPPQTVAVEESTATDQITKLAKDQRDLLLADLQPKLAALPAFSVVTDGKGTLPTLVRNGQPDPEAAALLGVLDPVRLAAEAAAFAATNPSDGQGLLAIAVEQNLEGLASWGSGWLTNAAPAEQETALGRLRQNPAFGDGQPLVAMAKAATDGGFRRSVFEVMADALHEPRIFEAFRQAIAAAQGNERRELIRLLVGKIPPDRIGVCSAWVSDPDPEVARMVFQTLQHRDPETGSSLVAPLIGAAPEAVQREMLDTLKRGPERLATATVALLRTLVTRPERDRVYREAWELLADTCSVPAGWQTVRDLEPTLTDPLLKARVRTALAQGAVHAGESDALALLDQFMAGSDPKARQEAAHRYFRVAGDIDARVKKALPLIARHGAEDGFFEALLRGFSESGMSKVKQPASPDLRQMLERASAHQDKMVRYFAHSLMYRAWSQGAKGFAAPLRGALARERDSWVKSQCANQVRAIDQAEKPDDDRPEEE